MTKHGILIAPDTVRFERSLPGPIEQVWRYITESDLRKRWLCAGHMDLRVGGNVELRFHNSTLSPLPDVEPPEKYADLPEQMVFGGTITRCDPPRLLSHTWEFEGENSEVTYELLEQGDRVLLVLTHRLLHSRDELLSVCGGWHTHLDILADILAGQTPRPFWERHTLCEAEYEKLLRK